MTTGFLSETQIGQLRGFPSISGDELLRHFTLTPAEIDFVAPGRGRSPSQRLGMAVQLCTLPWLGFVPSALTAAPAVAVARLATALSVDPEVLGAYGDRDQIRSDHLRLIVDRLGWKSAPVEGPARRELEQFLLDRAMEHDSPRLLFNLACEFLISRKTIRPGVILMTRLVGSARSAAVELTYEKVSPLLTDRITSELDDLVLFDADLGMSKLAWLSRLAVEATASSVKQQLKKLLFLRAVGAHEMDLSMLGGERRRFLATVGKRSTNQALARREPHQRYPILLNAVVQVAVDLLDEVIALFDQVISARESRAKVKVDEALAERAREGEDRQQLLTQILSVLADRTVPDEQVGGLLRDQIGRQELQVVHADGWLDLPRDPGRLQTFDASYSYFRQFTPKVLSAIDFRGGPGMSELMDAVAVLKELNWTGERNVPESAPVGFVPKRFASYLDQARGDGDEVAYRHYWELRVLLGLRDGLRSGDVHVPRSRRYADPSAYLFTPQQWEGRQGEFCALVGKPVDAKAALEQGKDELNTALRELDQVLADADAQDIGNVRLDAAQGVNRLSVDRT